jgi:hypothetical protein
MAELAAFQDAFVAALHDAALLDRLGDATQLATGFSVYRNTVHKGMRDALAANFPTVARLVGDEWFAGCAAVYGAGQLPQRASLFDYGGDFGEFLDGFEPAAELVYLGDVARLDRWWIEAHVAPDAPALAAGALVEQAAETLFELRLTLHPSARCGWFETPAPTIWQANRDVACALPDLVWRPEGALLARRAGAVEMLVIDAATLAFIAACGTGATLGTAASAALTTDPGFDVAAWLATLLRHEVFVQTPTRLT